MTLTIYIDWFLPAYKAGGPVQTVANLVARPLPGWQYRIITSNREWDGTVINVMANQWLSYNPWTKVYYASRGTSAKQLGEESAILYLNGIYSWSYVLKPLLFSKAGKKILAPRGMLLEGALSQKAWKKRLYLQLWKWAGLHRRVAFHATDGAEEAAIKKVFGAGVKVYQVPNLPKIIAPQPLFPKQRGALVLLTIALVSPMKNILPVLKALANLEQAITYHIYGPVIDPAYWQQCRKQIHRLPANIEVVYGGELDPIKVTETLQKAHVFILPSRSENFGHALYEALSAGRPVITSHTTPWNGLKEAGAGINLDPGEGKAIREVVRHFAGMNGDELQAWSTGARHYAEKRLDQEAIREQYCRMFSPPWRESSTSR
ncbi:glycosyltransferase [Flavisolibacter sp. BT320]|nr:glycosyltransferase [Flavisolibacter longurius]